MSNKQLIFCGSDKRYLKEELTKQCNEQNGGIAFRIPSLVNANGTLVAMIDKASNGCDWGYIELAVRTSKDNGKTWSAIKTIAAPPAREANAGDAFTSAFFIDPCMSVAANGDIVAVATFFPECKGLHDKKLLDKKKVSFANLDGEMTQLIYDRDGNFYYVTKSGDVLDKNKNKTDYKVTDWKGSLNKGDEYVGNIYLNGAVGKSTIEDTKTTFGAPLKATKRSYIFMVKSSDNGETWSEPQDITASVVKEENDGTFIGVAPGTGLTTSTGRIVMPLYTEKEAASIYSDDNGVTWNRLANNLYASTTGEWSLIEAPDNKVFGFGRQKKFKKTPVTVSADNGRIWYKVKNTKVKAPKCQKSTLVVGDTVYMSHASKKKRENGIISVGKFDINKKNVVKGIKWNKESIKINEGFFAYSCLAKINDNTIGVLYEDEPSSHIVFDTFTI